MIKQQTTSVVFPSSITSVAWSRSDDRFAVACQSGDIYVSSLSNPRKRKHLGTHTQEAVLHMAWSPDGTRLASGGDEGELIVWQPTTRRRLIERSYDAAIKKVLWTKQNGFLCVVNNAVNLWTIEESRYPVSSRWELGDEVLDVSWSRDGKYIAAITKDAALQMWSVKDRAEAFVEFLPSSPTSLTWTQNLVAVGNQNGNVLVYDRHGHLKAQHELSSYPIDALSWTTKRREFVAFSPRQLTIGDGEMLMKFPFESASAVFDRKGKRMAAIRQREMSLVSW